MMLNLLFDPTQLYSSPGQSLAYTAIVLVALWLCSKVARRLMGSPTPGGPLIPLYCALCQSLLLVGSQGSVFCSDCGIASCHKKECLNQAQRSYKCKEVTRRPVQQSPGMKRSGSGEQNVAQAEIEPVRRPRPLHHWVPGNLPLMSTCEVCDTACGEELGEAKDLKCSYCQRTVHSNCQRQLGEICDYGEFSRFIVPPECLTARPARTVRQPRRWWVEKVEPPKSPPNWSPLIVIGNKNAGNNDGEVFLNAFRGLLNPAQVVDLSHSRVEDALEWCHLIPVKCVVLIAGGDGTIGWVLNTIDKMKLDPAPTVALLPLGTGNDLARTLGYGAGGEITDAKEILRRIQSHTSPIQLDRWHVAVNVLKPDSMMPTGQRKDIYIQNYLSIGVDALVTYNFHRTRESKSVPFSGRLFNKTLYFIYGTKDVLERECKNLNHILDLEMDGKRIALPNIESVVVLNIPCWGAGVRPWELGEGHEIFSEPEYNDGRLEVFCIYSSFHIAQMQVGLSEPHRLGQAKEVRIRLYGRMPMQTDGEPWIQDPAEINIKHHTKVDMLKVGPEDH